MRSYEDIAEIWDKHNVFDILGTRFELDIENSFNWEAIHAELDLKDKDTIINWYEVEHENETPVYCCFVGTVFNLTPSGKYYTLWACSNVTPKEALKDEIWQEALEIVLERHNLFSQSGEGDLCDIFFCKEIV